MKIQELFQLILKYETDEAERELKYLLIKYIQKHATEVKQVLDNTRELVDTVAEMFNEDIDYLEELLRDILNYPEVIIEYKLGDMDATPSQNKIEKKLNCIIYMTSLSLGVGLFNLITTFRHT